MLIAKTRCTRENDLLRMGCQTDRLLDESRIAEHRCASGRLGLDEAIDLERKALAI